MCIRDRDIGICLGKCFYQALGDMRGIKRYGDIILPMDETLILCAVDISGRASLNCDIDIPSEKIGTFDTELIEEFLQAFVRNFPISLHIIAIITAPLLLTVFHRQIPCLFQRPFLKFFLKL